MLIDTSPDMRSQLSDAGVGRLDAVLYTHAHADHVHGMDDLRMIVINMRARLPVWADRPTHDALMERFGYAFVQPEGSMYPPILDLQPDGRRREHRRCRRPADALLPSPCRTAAWTRSASA